MSASHNLPFHLGTGNVRVNIRLDNFHFFHRPITGEPDEAPDGKYIDRANPIHQIYNWIRYNYAQSGSYLVTGYRGAGKSSFVGMLMKKLEEDKEKSGLDYISLSVNLGQENINEIEILLIIAKRLHDELLKRHREEYHSYQTRSNLIYTTLVIGGIFLGCTFYHLTDSSVRIYAIAAFLCFLLYGFLITFKTSPIVRAINKLKSLTERLHGSVQEEMIQNVGLSWEGILKAFSLQHRRTRDLPPATVQEIEYDLIAVLGLLQENNKKRKVIIIFDELDKADSGKQPEQSEDLPEFQKLSVRPEQKVSSRTRKQEVLRLIANMKYFLTSAKAYFIFIAGREMYEAYQADMSDRDFTISSIFSGVVNIDSFLISSRNTNNSNRMTEQFVCKQILPPNIEAIMKKAKDEGYDLKYPHSLRNCYHYWKQHIEEFYEDELDEDGNPDFEKRRQRLWRDMLFLYHFVNYLTYICNGSPKKLTLFFEKNVRRKSYLVQENKIKPLYRCRGVECVLENGEEGMNEEIFYLSFGYYSQMKVNFIHYLTYPIMQSIISRSNQYGDKLLVSSSFLISHIFKLHNTGFSWRNLEQTPELLEINKTPEIREYISSIIDFMNHTHLTTIVCGLFHYKFPMRIAEEISFHSKISGEISAVFNFSLDEMQSTKNHYARVLKATGDGADKATRYSHASIHHSLGDIYMQEENYSDAIREYEKCVEIVAPIVSDLTDREATQHFQLLNYLSFLNRTMLKLGLAHEKRRTDNSAFIIYEELIRILTKSQENAQTLFNNMRTFHLALLAKLYVLEKIDTMGICKCHLYEVFNGFRKLFGKRVQNRFVLADFYRKLGDILYYKNRSFTLEEWKVVVNAKSLYRRSLEELLGKDFNLETGEENKICEELCKLSLSKSKKWCTSAEQASEVNRDNYIYHMGLCLEDLGHVALSEYKDGFDFDGNFLTEFLKKIQTKEENPSNGYSPLNITPSNNAERAILYYWVAARLYNVSCERGLSTNAYLESLYALLTYVRRLKKKEYRKVDAGLVLNIAKELAKHYLISRYRQYEHIHMSEQDLLRWMIGAEVYRFVEPGISSISSDMEELISVFYTLELRLYKIVPGKGREALLPQLARFYHSDIMTGRHTGSTLTATVLNYKVKAKFDEQLLASLFGCNVEGLDEVRLSDVADMVYREVTDRMVLTFFDSNGLKDVDGKLDLLEALIIEGMFCLTRIVELVVPLRNSMLFNNSFKADIYVHLLRFNYLYRLLYSYYSYGINRLADRATDEFLSGKTGCRTAAVTDGDVSFCNDRTVRSLRPPVDMIGRQRDMSVKMRAALGKEEPTYTYLCFLAENAIHYYTKARQVHSQGKSYQELIRNLFFLEDDLNNDTLHFYLALERFDITSRVQFRLERQLKERYQYNPLYDIRQYFAHESNEEGN